MNNKNAEVVRGDPNYSVSDQEAILKEPKGLGLLPFFSLIMAVGLLIVAIADNRARAALPFADVLYWIGLFVIFVPMLIRILSPNISQEERVGLVLTLGMGLYFVKLFYSPLEFKYPDELQHWRTEIDILQTGHLFSANPGLPISPFYPGLQIITNAFLQLSGSTIFYAGIVVIAIARCVLTLAMYFLYKEIGQSSRVAGLANVIYMVNPHYMFVNSFFIYQTLALALLALGLYAIAKRENVAADKKSGLRIIIILALTAIIVTHHITSYALIIFLIFWLLASLIIKSSHSSQTLPISIVVLTLAETVAWIFFISPGTIDYFRPVFTTFFQDIWALISLKSNLVVAFRAPTGPILDRVLNLGAVGVIALSLLPAIWFAWRRYRRDSLALSMAIGSFCYFAILWIRVVSTQGAELSGRSWPFVFIPVAFVLAVAIFEVSDRWLKNRNAYLYITPLLVFIFVGGIMGGEPSSYERLPGPYIAGSFERSIEPQGVSAAKWTETNLGPNNRITSDFTNYTLMSSYGEQDPVRATYSIFYSPGKDSKDIKEIQYYDVRYLVVDHRISSALPASGRYFDIVDPHSYNQTNPITNQALWKFNTWNDVDRIFDSGDIVIYDLRRLSDDQ